MTHLGIQIPVRNIPEFDAGFVPMALFCREYLNQAEKPLSIAIERNDGLTAVYDTFVTGRNVEADRYYVERTVKTLLWVKGGYKVYICGDVDIAAYIKDAYSGSGSRAFDKMMMERIYESGFEVISLPLSCKPAEKEQAMPIGGNLKGCRIGFDAGGSDRKVSAVIDGEAVYSEEVVWHPKTNPDPDYHYREIVAAFKTAASKMPRVDSIGVSSAGVYISNRTMAASLFIKVPEELFNSKVKDIYIRAAREIGDVPLNVVNDGDVTALAGAMELAGSDAPGEHFRGSAIEGQPHLNGSEMGEAALAPGTRCPALGLGNSVLGVAMGTSEAGGFVDANGNITGWLNELAFAPVDANPLAMADEWSGDIGCGVKYFSQDGVIKLAAAAGMELPADMTPGEKLKAVQDGGDPRAAGIFRSIGCYLGHTLPYYHEFYRFRHVLVLGRVMSGTGGNLIAEAAKAVLSEEYPDCKIDICVPDENNRRIGQSIAAASL